MSEEVWDDRTPWGDEYGWNPWWNGKAENAAHRNLAVDFKKHVDLGGMGEASFHMTRQESYYPKALVTLHVIKKAAEKIRQ